jgi:lysophospholipase L1-like esterase
MISHVITHLVVSIVAILALGACQEDDVNSGRDAKKERSIRIVALGDSTTEAEWEGNAEVVYADRLEAALEARGIAVEMINAGLSNTTSRQAVERLDSDVRRHDPDYVIIQFGINDSWIDANMGRTEPRLTLDEYESHLKTIIQTVRGDGAKPILMTPNPMRWSPLYGDEYKNHPELGFDVDDPRGINRLLDVYAQRARDLARKEGVPLIDVFARFEAYDQVPGQSIAEILIPNDDIHPSDPGHALIAEWLTDFLLRDLKNH